jgi:hypothetical protein
MSANDIYAVTWFDRLPLPAVFILTVAFVMVAIALGVRLAAISRKSAAGKGEGLIGSAVGATLGMLAFILAFTFGMTASRFDARKQLLLDEVNAIGTAYLRAGLLPQPYQSQMRTLLRDYVDVRADFARSPETLASAMKQSEALHDRMWSLTERMTARERTSIAQGLFIQSLNDVIDIHSKRVVVGLQYRVPSTIWFGLYGVAALAMVVVGYQYQFGQSRLQRLTLSTLLALAFSAVILLIADLDRSGEGSVKVNQQPLFELQQKLRTSP